jgi:hypothetical protein
MEVALRERIRSRTTEESKLECIDCFSSALQGIILTLNVLDQSMTQLLSELVDEGHSLGAPVVLFH